VGGDDELAAGVFLIGVFRCGVMLPAVAAQLVQRKWPMRVSFTASVVTQKARKQQATPNEDAWQFAYFLSTGVRSCRH
jgi:hypothetical protein